MKFKRKSFPKVEDLETDVFLNPIWPEEVLIAAREGLITSGYVMGADELLRAGKFDNWPAMQAACYALCNHLDIEDVLPKVEGGKPLTTLDALSQLNEQVVRDIANA